MNPSKHEDPAAFRALVDRAAMDLGAVGASTPEAEAACASCPPEPAVRFPKIEVRRTCATTCSRLCTSGLGEAPPATAE